MVDGSEPQKPYAAGPFSRKLARAGINTDMGTFAAGAAACVVCFAFAVCLMFSREIAPSAFEWSGGINWCKAAFAVCAAGLAVARAARRDLSHLERLAQTGGALVLAILLGMSAWHGMEAWEADRASGPSDATAIVVDYHEEEDDDDIDWVMRVRTPDGSEREWTFDNRPSPEPREGEAVDITYYPRTNTLIALDIGR
ncbi:hypothetical protein [Bifidobacterium vespertilionis]|uniref:hypothetical protein n=1 Tax=Bifidobacterium vespertilionis TaxID=2562524 RepID=UPI001BDCBAD1|nr:hypothetical protein [Bifidobacterium vespertilionis]MBT1179570.1 hypothetical protein [Bifidobacterium vespertilionis]